MASVSLVSSSLLNSVDTGQRAPGTSASTGSVSQAASNAAPQDTVTLSSGSPAPSDAQQAGLFQVASPSILTAQIGLLDLTGGPAASSAPPTAASSQAPLTSAVPANLPQAAPTNGPSTPSQTTNSALFARFVTVLNQLNLNPGTLNFLKSLGRMLEQVDPQAFGQLIQGLELLAQSLASGLQP